VSTDIGQGMHHIIHTAIYPEGVKTGPPASLLMRFQWEPLFSRVCPTLPTPVNFFPEWIKKVRDTLKKFFRRLAPKNSAPHCYMHSSHCRHGQDKTVLSRLVRVGSVNRSGDKSRLMATKISKSFFQSRNEVLRTTEISLDLSPILFTPPTRQVCVVGVN